MGPMTTRHLSLALLALSVTAPACAVEHSVDDGDTPVEEGDFAAQAAVQASAAEACLSAYGARGAGGKPYFTKVNGIYFSNVGFFDESSFDPDGRAGKRGKTFAQCMKARTGKAAHFRVYSGIAAEREVLQYLSAKYPSVKKAVAGGATMAWLDYAEPLQPDAVVLAVTFNGAGMDAFLGAAALNQVVGAAQEAGFRPDLRALLQQIGVGVGVERAEAFGWKDLGASGSFALTISRWGQVFFTPTPGYSFKAPLSLSASVLFAPASDAAGFKSFVSGAGSSICFQIGVPTWCGVKSGPGLAGPTDSWGFSVGATFPPGVGFGASWGRTEHLGNFDFASRKYTPFKKPSHLART